MPANLTLEFGKKNEEYQAATSLVQKTRLLRELIALAPKHKGTEKLLGRLKKSLKKLESKIVAEKIAKKSGGKKGIKKIAPVIALVGPPNSGKTTVFKSWTGEGRPHNYPNSTQQPETAVALYKEARLQIVDTPSFDGSYGHNADVVIICGPDHSLGKQFKRQHVLIADNYRSNDKILEAAWNALGLIRVFTPDGKYPMLTKKGSIVSDVAKKIHKSFVDNFEWAKIKRNRRTFRVGLDFIVNDGDLLILRSRIA